MAGAFTLAVQAWARVLSCGHVVVYRLPPMVGDRVWCLRCDMAVAVVAIKEPTHE